ncbi:MAG: HEAT repeat domain-containing protein [Nitrospirae bacterium]|nr:HEAT repeat domain-containing protein [Nitrospirota bacterium]
MPEDKQEKLPLDAKLLSDAVIELNISRRSVGLYPPEHPIVRASIERAFEHLRKLFEIRAEITLGIAKNALIVDEYTLDRRNPVFREFAQTLHAKGIAAITFSLGLGQRDLTRLHELISAQDTAIGRELAELAEKEISHIRLSPIDLENFCFVEGAQRSGSACGDVWEDYVYGLLEGKLGEGDGIQGILSIPPETVADMVNAALPEEAGEESYDRVITAYIKKKSDTKISREAFNKFFSFIDRLRPEIKRQFLSRAGSRLTEDIGDVEAIINGMTPEGFEKIAELLTENSSIIPTTLKNLIDKLSSIKKDNRGHFDFFSTNAAVLHDIELGDEVMKLFGEDNFHSYVGKEYQRELERMLEVKAEDNTRFAGFRKECEEQAIDKEALEIMLELLHEDYLKPEDQLTLISKLFEFMNVFSETGRFEEILDTYDTLMTHVFNGRFNEETAGIIDYFFHSEEFITKLLEAFRIWGRKEREGALRLARALHRAIIDPLLDALEKENDASTRKFFLSLLEAIGSDVVPFALGRLNDNRWFVVRNMICIIRDCNGKPQLEKIRKFLRHENINVRMEALKTLLHFKTLDAVPQLRACLQSEAQGIRTSAIRLAGSYRIREAVPYLIKYLEKSDLLGTEAYYKTDIVRALGEIGDIRAVETLEKICHTRALFYRENLESLKVEIFKSLEKYPRESVRKLIDLGLESRNEEIHALSYKLLATLHASEKTGEMTDG